MCVVPNNMALSSQNFARSNKINEKIYRLCICHILIYNEKRKADCFGHTLLKNCFLKHVTEGKLE